MGGKDTRPYNRFLWIGGGVMVLISLLAFSLAWAPGQNGSESPRGYERAVNAIRRTAKRLKLRQSIDWSHPAFHRAVHGELWSTVPAPVFERVKDVVIHEQFEDQLRSAYYAKWRRVVWSAYGQMYRRDGTSGRQFYFYAYQPPHAIAVATIVFDPRTGATSGQPFIHCDRWVPAEDRDRSLKGLDPITRRDFLALVDIDGDGEDELRFSRISHDGTDDWQLIHTYYSVDQELNLQRVLTYHAEVQVLSSFTSAARLIGTPDGIRTNVIQLRIEAENYRGHGETHPAGWVEFERQPGERTFELKQTRIITDEKRLGSYLQAFFFRPPSEPSSP